MDGLFTWMYRWSADLEILLLLVALLAANKLIARAFGIVRVPDDAIGLITKKFVLYGRNRRLPDGKIIALNGEAGLQADTLAPGLHAGFWPWQYRISMSPFITIPQGKFGVVEACDGGALPSGRIVADMVDCDTFQDARSFLEKGGQRGPQMGIIPPGTYRLNLLLFKISLVDATTVPAVKVGVVQALDGAPIPPGRVLARSVECNSFQDADKFMKSGGQRGPQMAVVGPGTYRINPYLFALATSDAVTIPDNKVGIVTTKEGAPLVTGNIAGAEVPGHDAFQSPAKFIDGGGTKGLQEQVLLAGRYFINPQFASVELVEMTLVPIANVGVVISYVGKDGVDVSGETFKHGNLVSTGEKGVCIKPLDPGRYAINPYTKNVKMVPTANVVLNWANGKSEAHKLDADLCTITVRSGDGFKFNLDVAQIIHVPANDAPRVIARFGEMKELVTQVLEPLIGNYFRNAAQRSDVIDFLNQRTARQQEARDAISAALQEYNVIGVDTLIGDIVPPDALMKTLTDRKIAEQEKVTYATQMASQTQRQSYEQANALASTQATVVAAERQVAIAKFNADSAVAKATGEAGSRVATAQGDAQANVINAEANAKVAIAQANGEATAKVAMAEANAKAVTVNGNAEAGKTLAIGTAEADVIKLKIESMEAGNYAVVQVAQALGTSGQALVPQIVASTANDGRGGTIVDVLMAGLLRDQAGKKAA